MASTFEPGGAKSDASYIRIPALGNAYRVGDGYDFFNDVVVPSNLGTNQKCRLGQLQEPVIVVPASYKAKAQVLRFNDSIQLAIFSGMRKPLGTALRIWDLVHSKDQLHLVVGLRFVTYREKLESHDLVPAPFQITAIDYGYEVFVILHNNLRDDEIREKTETSVKMTLERLMRMQWSEDEDQLVQNMADLNFEIITDHEFVKNKPSSIDSLVPFLRNYHSYFDVQSSSALDLWIAPTSSGPKYFRDEFVGENQALVCAAMLTFVKNVQVQATIVQQSSAYGKLDQIRAQFNDFSNFCVNISRSAQETLKQLVISLRQDKVFDVDIDFPSALFPGLKIAQLNQWMMAKKNELNLLERYPILEKVEIVFTEAEIDAVLNQDQVTIAGICGTPWPGRFLISLQEFLSEKSGVSGSKLPSEEGILQDSWIQAEEIILRTLEIAHRTNEKILLAFCTKPELDPSVYVTKNGAILAKDFRYPGQIDRLELSLLTESRAVLTWRLPEDGSEFLDLFMASVKNLKENTEVTETIVTKDVARNGLIEWDCKGLTPYTPYWIEITPYIVKEIPVPRVSLQNMIATLPAGSPSQLGILKITQNSAIIGWSEPVLMIPGLNQRYEVKYREYGSGLSTVVETEEPRCLIQGLKRKRRYQVTVRMNCGYAGLGYPSDPLEFTTLSALHIPELEKFFRGTTVRILMSQEALEKELDKPRGNSLLILSCRLQDDGFIDSFKKILLVPGPKNPEIQDNATLLRLINYLDLFRLISGYPKNRYKLDMFVHVEHGCPQFQVSLKHYMGSLDPEILPIPERIQSATWRAIRTDAILIRWSYDAEEPQQYCIQWHSEDPTDRVPKEATFVIQPAEVPQFLIEDLYLNKRYQVCIGILMGSGRVVGPKCKLRIATPAASRPKIVEVIWKKDSEVGLQWIEPETLVRKPGLKYLVSWKSSTEEDFSRSAEFAGLTCRIEDLEPETEYEFVVQAYFHPDSKGMESDPIRVKTDPPRSLAQKMLDLSTVPKSGTPSIYDLRLQEEYLGPKRKHRRCCLPRLSQKQPVIPARVQRKVLLVMGATGAGKSTLINGFVNYVLGVDWGDDFRFRIIGEETTKNQAHSQTESITVYELEYSDGFQIPYSLTIIDTPGFGDTRGIDRDKEIADLLRDLFTETYGIDFVDAVCFVTQAALSRLTCVQTYVFNSVLALFGKDIAENIQILVTFADGQTPPVLAAIEEGCVPCPRDPITNQLVHHKFNNSALYAFNGQDRSGQNGIGDENFDQMFWRMGAQSFKKFFLALDRLPNKSLRLSKEVLEERKRLETTVEGLHPQIQSGLVQMEEIRRTKQILESHEAELKANENFEFEVEVMVPVQVDISGTGRFITNCQVCHFTCHYPCLIAEDDKKIKCNAMDPATGTCKVCPGKCPWNIHFNQKYRFDYTKEKRTRTVDELQEKYKDAEGKRLTALQLVQSLESEMAATTEKIHDLARATSQHLRRLEEIALRPNHFSAPELVDMMIEGEKAQKKRGYGERLKSLMQLKDYAFLMQKIENGEEVLAAPGSYQKKEKQGKKKSFVEKVSEYLPF